MTAHFIVLGNPNLESVPVHLNFILLLLYLAMTTQKWWATFAAKHHSPSNIERDHRTIRLEELNPGTTIFEGVWLVGEFVP